MRLNWKIDSRGDRVAIHARGFYRIVVENDTHVVLIDDATLGMSINAKIAQEMAERHAETGFVFSFPPSVKF